MKYNDDIEKQNKYLKNRKTGLHWRRLSLLAPKTNIVIDVGAAGGTRQLYAAFPGAKFFLIDALEENREKLARIAQKIDAEVIIQALGSSKSKKSFNVSADGRTGKSSFLDRYGAFADVEFFEREMSVLPLDDVIQGIGDSYPVRCGLKIDAEGYEREILLGSKNILKSCDWIVCEVSMSPRFVDDPLFAGIYDLATEAGFAFRDFIDLVRQGKGDLRRIDAVFVRKNLVDYAQEQRAERQRLEQEFKKV